MPMLANNTQQSKCTMFQEMQHDCETIPHVLQKGASSRAQYWQQVWGVKDKQAQPAQAANAGEHILPAGQVN